MVNAIFLPLTAIILVSFGTSFDETREKTIEVLTKNVATYYNATIIEEKENLAIAKAKSLVVLEAYTSSTIIKKLDKRGIQKSSVTQALKKAKEIGMQHIIIQPTHLMFGLEYNEIIELASSYKDDFETITYGAPLLATNEDIHSLLLILKKAIPLQKDEALVLMGHGTKHFSNFLYAAMDFQAKQEGFSNVFVGTVEAYPDINCTVQALKKAGYKKAVLTPLMLVAGDHATKDMASDKDSSYKSVLEKNGIKTRLVMKGLGEYQEVRDIYISHINATMKQ